MIVIQPRKDFLFDGEFIYSDWHFSAKKGK